MTNAPGNTPQQNPEDNNRELRLNKLDHNQMQDLINRPREERIKAAEDAISSVMDKGKKLEKTSKRARPIADSVARKLMEVPRSVEQSVKAIQDEAIKAGKTLGELNKALEVEYKKLDQIVAMVTSSIDNLTFEEGQITAEVLAYISREASNLVEILTKDEHKDLRNALGWALGLADDEGRSLEHYKPKAFEALAKQFNKKDFDSSINHAAFFTLSMMKPLDMLEFTDQYLKDLSEADRAEFLWAGNARGIYSKQQMEEYISLTDEEAEKAVKIYTATNEFPKTVKYMMRENGLTHEDATIGYALKNVIGPLMIATTIFANVAVATFNGGKFQSLPSIIRNVATNHNIWAAVAGKVFLDNIRGKENFFNKPAETDQMMVSRLESTMNSSRALGEFLHHPDGPAVFSGFVREYKEGDEFLIKSDSLESYIDRQIAKSPDERDIKGADLESLKKTIHEREVDPKKVITIATSFRQLGIGSGTSKIAREQFQNVLAKRGSAKPEKPTQQPS